MELVTNKKHEFYYTLQENLGNLLNFKVIFKAMWYDW